MLLKYFYDKRLAHASYMVGCQKTGAAIIVDPSRDIQQYLDAAKTSGLKIVGVAETHIHADYVSGAREMADRIGATLYVSDEGPSEWKYEFAKDYDHQLLKNGDTFSVGNIEFQCLFTPGHTPESICFQLTDTGGGANKPMGIFTGDFVFVGSVGRPDLLEEAAGIVGSAEPGARDLFRSTEKFKQLPDYLQIWPAHGAGSACGKGLGAIPSSTVGYEKMFNPALQYTDEQAFVDYILTDQPDAPRYFAIMKRVNKEGPELLGGDVLPAKLDVELLSDVVADHQVYDTAPTPQFVKSFMPGTIHLPIRFLAGWGGFIINYDQPLYLIVSKKDLHEAVRVLQKIGADDIAGYFDAEEVESAGLKTHSLTEQTPQQLSDRITNQEFTLVDVRRNSEWKSGRIEGSIHHFLPTFENVIDQLERDKPILFICKTDGRAVISASIAQKHGIDNMIVMTGGLDDWKLAGLPLVTATGVDQGPRIGQSV